MQTTKAWNGNEKDFNSGTTYDSLVMAHEIIDERSLDIVVLSMGIIYIQYVTYYVTV